MSLIAKSTFAWVKKQCAKLSVISEEELILHNGFFFIYYILYLSERAVHGSVHFQLCDWLFLSKQIIACLYLHKTSYHLFEQYFQNSDFNLLEKRSIPYWCKSNSEVSTNSEESFLVVGTLCSYQLETGRFPVLRGLVFILHVTLWED